MIHSITPAEGKALLDSGTPLTLLDVRTPAEQATGIIPGALLLPLSALAAQAPALLPDKQRPILVYCQSGIRAAKAAALLETLGYTDLRVLGGIQNWPYEVVIPDEG